MGWSHSGKIQKHEEALLLDDLRALVEFAQAGSIARAADRLFRTPSAITRQMQRLEAALGAELLDRSVKPPRLNSLGSRVLEQARELLRRTEALKSLASSDAEPHGLLRIGLSHALAEGTVIEAMQGLTEKYPKVRVRLSSELTGELIKRLLAGELDVAAVLLPEGKAAPPPLVTKIIAIDRMEIVQGAAGNVAGSWKSLAQAPWVLNPPGCFLRATLIDRMERAGFTPMIAAEIHNMHMQLAFVQSGYGVGLLPARFIARSHAIDAVKVLRPPSFELHRSVAIVQVGQLGAVGKAVEQLADGLRHLFEAADTRKPVTSHRRGVPANRRAVRPHRESPLPNMRLTLAAPVLEGGLAFVNRTVRRRRLGAARWAAPRPGDDATRNPTRLSRGSSQLGSPEYRGLLRAPVVHHHPIGSILRCRVGGSRLATPARRWKPACRGLGD